MTTTKDTHTCKNCGYKGEGKYCSTCGQIFFIERITLKHLLGEVFHFFTHFEHGFGYTLKQLLKEPGTIQKNYLEGHRAKLQKPFSMFFLCATACGLAEYWINFIVSKYFNAGDVKEIYFFQHYLVFEQVLLSPLYALSSWLIFIRFKYNYAEWLVITFYVTSFFFLLIIPVNALKFIWPHLETRYIEFPIITAYNIITTINLLKAYSRWKVVAIGCCVIAINYTLAITAQHIIINII